MNGQGVVCGLYVLFNAWVLGALYCYNIWGLNDLGLSQPLSFLDFPLYLGKNVVGRMPDCSVALPFPSISKQHAVIEISAWDKAPVLQDCGSLNGTQILRPPMVLRPGVSHRLRDHELILFADLPCQYRHLEEPMPMPSRGPLSVEETPRIPGDAHASRLPLAEDSDEEEAGACMLVCWEGL